MGVDILRMIGLKKSKFEDFNVDVDTSDPPEDLKPLIEQVDNPEEGLFGPESMMWKVNRENIVATASGITAVLLQIAHPKVAAGVAEHSTFEEDTFGRFQRTREIVESIIFGDLETALEASMIIRRVHGWVTGELQEDVGPFEEGEKYEANEPENLLWVHATMIEQALTMYDIYVEELSDEEKEQYYQESKAFGQAFGVPRDYYPETLDDFWDYYERELEETIVVSERGMRLKESLFSGNFFLERHVPTFILSRVYSFYGMARMPEPTREQFNAKWDGRLEKPYKLQAKVLNKLLPFQPNIIRYNWTYRKRMKELGRDHKSVAPPKPRPTPIGAD